MIKVKKYDNSTVRFISILYTLTIIILMLDIVDNFPFGYYLRKIKYIYLLIVLIYFIYSFKGVISSKVSILLSFLSLHTVLFGYVFVNKSVAALTHENAREMLIYIALVSLTYFFVWNEGLFKDFMKWNYWGISFVLLWCGVTHPSHFVNPLYFVYFFSGIHSYRTTFGMGHANFTGNMCLFALIYSVFLLEEIRNKRPYKELLGSKTARWIIFTDIIIGEMLFSTQSRTSVLAAIVFISVYIYCNWKELLKLSKKVRLISTIVFVSCVIAFFISDGFTNVWSISNRDSNVAVNYPIFRQFNAWTGMGYIPSSGFLTKAYGLNTFALDIYYLYIFFTTGYLGSLIITLFLTLTFWYAIHIKERGIKVLILSMFFAILFTGIGQTNMISYILLPSMINWVTVFLGISPSRTKIRRQYK